MPTWLPPGWLAPAALAAALAAPALSGCDPHLEARVDGVLLPQALGVIDAPPGTTLVLAADRPVPALPATGPVRLAIDHATPWSRVEPVLRAARSAGLDPVVLVGQRDRIHGFVVSDHLEPGYAMRLTADATGKFCLSPPGTREQYCQQSSDRRHISATFVRGVVKRAAAEYGLDQVRVDPTPDVAWGDLVRTIDGARTCCSSPIRVAVRH